VPRRRFRRNIATRSPEPWRERLRLYGIAQGRAPLTIRSYVYDVGLLLRWLTERHIEPEGAEQDDILHFLDWYKMGRNDSGVARRFASIRFYYAWLRATGRRPDDPTEGVHPRQPARPPKRPFTEDELRQLLAVCRRQQERAIVLLLIETGLRLNEMVSIRRADIDGPNGLLRVRGKGGKERTVAVGAIALVALAASMAERDYPWRSQRLHGPMSRDGLYRLIRRLGGRAGIQKVHPHRFRTSFACMFLERTDGDVGSAQVLMGHSKLETTLQYAGWIKQSRALDQMRRHSLADRIAG